MAGYNTKKTGSSMDSWDYYIPTGVHSIDKPFKIEKNGELLDDRGQVIIKFSRGEEIEVVDVHAVGVGSNKKAKVRYAGKEGWTKIANIQKRTTVHLKGGIRVQERQEQGVIDAINGYAEQYGSAITIKDKRNRVIKNITGADKNNGTNTLGKEPYADVWLFSGTKKLGVSNKGESAPSVAGGGLAGVYSLNPKYIHEVYELALKEAIKAGFKEGENPKSDIYVLIKNKQFLRDAVIGTPEMGGPIEYMYIGKMDVEFEIESPGVLKFTNGEFIPATAYLAKYPNLYFRIRRRNSSSKFTLDRDPRRNNLPKIFKGADGISRLVIEKTAPATGIVIK